MDQDVLRDQWKHCRRELNYQWAQLSSADLDGVDGKRDNLVDLLERCYGFTRRRAEREVDSFVKEFSERLRRAC